MASKKFARGRKTSLTFLKNKNFTSGQKHRERIGTAVPKHRKTSKTDQNSKSYPKKTEGWAFNSWTQFRCSSKLAPEVAISWGYIHRKIA